MAIRTKRRARFRRATSGTQNLTTLIYNILRDQQTARKQAMLTAFNANMSTKTYDSTYGGEVVDRAAVEAFYIDLMSAYPEGTTERDKLAAELNDFRASALRQEMSAYADAYENGTYAFGEQVTMNKYLTFLRDAKSLTNNEADKIEYTKEEFLVTFNDISSDMKAKNASAGSFARFYDRQLKRAEEMGLSKDSKVYRDIQGYLADASDRAADDFKRKQLQDAVDVVSKRTAKLASTLIESAKEAANAGLMTQDDVLAIQGNGDPMGVVSRWLSLGLDSKIDVILSGQKAGIMLGEAEISSDSIIAWTQETRESIKILAKSSMSDAATKAQALAMLTQFDAELSGPMGLLTGLEAADRSSLNLTLDNERSLGNPLTNVELYQRHANNIAEEVGTDIMGRGLMSILNGRTPEGGKDFLDSNGDPVEFIADLSQSQVDRLVATYTGTALIFTNGSVDPKELITGAVNDYRSADLVQSGEGYLKAVPYGANGVVIEVVNKPVSNGIVTLSSGDLTEGGGWQVLAKQEKTPILTQEGAILGYTFFEIDENNRRVQKVLTLDNYVMDQAAYLKYLDGIGGSSYDAENGGISVAGLSPELIGRASTGALIKQNASWGKYVSDSTFDNIARGPGADVAISEVSKTIYQNLTESGTLDLAFGLDGDGNLVVRNEDLAFRETSLLASDILDLFNSEAGSRIKREVGTAILTRARGVDGEGYAGMGAAPEMFETPEGGTSLTPTPEQASTRMDRGYVAASQMYDQLQANKNLRDAIGPNPEQNPFYIGGLGIQGLSNLARPTGEQAAANPFRTQAAGAAARLRVPGEMAASPYTKYGLPQASVPGLDSSYAFRYAGGTQLDAGIPKADSSFKGTSLSTGLTDSRPPAQSISFTPQQLSQSLVDFRAGERAPLNISTSTSTNGRR